MPIEENGFRGAMGGADLLERRQLGRGARGADRGECEDHEETPRHVEAFAILLRLPVERNTRCGSMTRNGSENIEDRRGMRIPGGKGLAGGGIGIVVIALIAMFLGIDPGVVTQVAEQVSVSTAPQQRVETKAPAREDQMADFIAAVLGSTEETWTEIFARGGKKYQKPVLVLFSGTVASACGRAQAAVGPFYCPADNKLYIDLAFYRDLQDKFRAPGDFAQAYVIAHEVGHHVQNLLGIAEQVRRAQSRGGEGQSNALQVRMELQADCFAGAGFSLFAGGGFGRWMGVIGASLTAIVSLLSIPAAPFWALCVFALSVIVVYELAKPRAA